MRYCTEDEAKDGAEKIQKTIKAIGLKRLSHDDLTYILAAFLTDESPQELDEFLDNSRKSAIKHKIWLKVTGGNNQ